MDCKEFEKKIPDFIKKDMDFITLKRFMQHGHRCAKCKEELTIQFLIDEGLVRLEEGSAFDLNYELRSRVQEAEKKIRRHEFMLRLGMYVEVAVMVAAAGIVLQIILG